MTPFEYVIPLVSLLVGLAITDLAVSLNRLLRARARVEWDWLTLATAFVAIVAVLDIWWMFYGIRDETSYHTLLGFLPYAFQLIILFLVNAAALPDDVSPGGIRLRAFYAGNSRYLWSLFTLYVVSALVHHSGEVLREGVDLAGYLRATGLIYCFVGLFGSLIFVRRRWYHGFVMLAFAAAYFSTLAFRSLDGML